MLKVVNQEKRVWLSYEEIRTFPCEDLRTIDQLWMHYSGGKFGFSAQKKLWLECGGKISHYNRDLVFKKFAGTVGWYHLQDGNWRTYDEFMNDTQNAQNTLPASLPAFMSMGCWVVLGGVLWWGWDVCISSLASRRDL